MSVMSDVLSFGKGKPFRRVRLRGSDSTPVRLTAKPWPPPPDSPEREGAADGQFLMFDHGPQHVASGKDTAATRGYSEALD